MNRNQKEKSVRIELRAEPKSKEKVKQLAKVCGLSVSEYMVQRALGYAPKPALPDAFYDFYGKLCELCNEEDAFTPETENKLLALIDEIHSNLLLPGKASAKQIVKEANDSWQPPDSGR